MPQEKGPQPNSLSELQQRVDPISRAGLAYFVEGHQNYGQLLDANVHGYDLEKRTVPGIIWQDGKITKDIEVVTHEDGKSVILMGFAWVFSKKENEDGSTTIIERVKMTEGTQCPISAEAIAATAEAIYQEIGPLRLGDLPVSRHTMPKEN